MILYREMIIYKDMMKMGEKTQKRKGIEEKNAR